MKALVALGFATLSHESVTLVTLVTLVVERFTQGLKRWVDDAADAPQEESHFVIMPLHPAARSLRARCRVLYGLQSR